VDDMPDVLSPYSFILLFQFSDYQKAPYVTTT
jgi:hypothetical protein